MSSLEKGRLDRFVRKESGSLTLEASIIVPMLIWIVLALLASAFFHYESTDLKKEAVLAAERTAYSWSNSNQSYETGRAYPGSDDGLYWRVFYDRGLLSFLVGHMPGEERASWPETADQYTKGSLIQTKLLRSASYLDTDTTAQMTYRNGWMSRIIEAKLERSFSAPVAGWTRQKMHVQSESKSWIIEPAEFIRTIRLVQTWGKQWNVWNNDRSQVNDALHRFIGLQAPKIYSHDRDAVPFLQKMTNGTYSEMETSHGRRQIDALDESNTAHMAYVTFTEKQLREQQMPKDIELLREGKVSGVVWHFFRREGKSGRTGPSDQLRRLLEQNGITVIIHH